MSNASTLPPALMSCTPYTLAPVISVVTFKSLITLPLKLNWSPFNVSNALTLPAELINVVANKLAPVTVVVTFKSLITLPVKLNWSPFNVLPALTFAIAEMLFEKLIPPALDEIVCVPT